jgi:hypothetical protein
MATGANALPALPLSDAVLKGHATSDLVEQVQYQRPHSSPSRTHRHHRAAPPRHVHRHYRPGGRYRTAPHGWHRYGARPSNWQRRGCVIVGPVWFCP